MAVVASLMPHQGQYFCLMLDDESDSIEVVFPSGFEHDEETGDIEFAAAYFVDAPAGPGLPFREVTIRMDEATDAPAGLMVERVSSYGQESAFALVPRLCDSPIGPSSIGAAGHRSFSQVLSLGAARRQRQLSPCKRLRTLRRNFATGWRAEALHQVRGGKVPGRVQPGPLSEGWALPAMQGARE